MLTKPRISNPTWHSAGLWLVLSGLLLTVGMPGAEAQATTVVRIEPTTLVLVNGEEGAVVVVIENAADLYGFELHLQFDPETLQVVDGDPEFSGTQMLPGDMFAINQGFLVINQADNQSGEIVYAFTQLAPAPPLSGDGSLVVIELQAITEGNSALAMEGVILASPDGQPLPFVSQDAEVIVETDPAGTPVTGATRPVVPSLTAPPVPSPTPGLVPTEIGSATPAPSATPPPALPTPTSLSAFPPTVKPFPSGTPKDSPMPSGTGTALGLPETPLFTPTRLKIAMQSTPRGAADQLDAIPGVGEPRKGIANTGVVILLVALIAMLFGGSLIYIRRRVGQR